jgi:hypothetical protein
MTVSPSFYFLSPRTLVVTKLEELARIEYGTWVFLLFYFLLFLLYLWEFVSTKPSES